MTIRPPMNSITITLKDGMLPMLEEYAERKGIKLDEEIVWAIECYFADRNVSVADCYPEPTLPEDLPEKDRPA